MSKTAEPETAGVRTQRTHKHAIRAADGGIVTISRLSRTQAMAAMCSECLGWEDNPADCTDLLCPLWPWRARTRLTVKSDEDWRMKYPDLASRVRG